MRRIKKWVNGNKILSICLGVSLLILVWNNTAPAVNFEHNMKTLFLNELLGDPHTWSGTQTFDDVTINSGTVSGTTVQPIHQTISGTDTLLYTDMGSEYTVDTTGAITIPSPGDDTSLPNRRTRFNIEGATGGVSLVLVGGSFGDLGNSGATLYTYDTYAVVDVGYTASGNSAYYIVGAGNFNVDVP